MPHACEGSLLLRAGTRYRGGTGAAVWAWGLAASFVLDEPLAGGRGQTRGRGHQHVVGTASRKPTAAAAGRTPGKTEAVGQSEGQQGRVLPPLGPRLFLLDLLADWMRSALCGCHLCSMSIGLDVALIFKNSFPVWCLTKYLGTVSLPSGHAIAHCRQALPCAAQVFLSKVRMARGPSRWRASQCLRQSS